MARILIVLAATLFIAAMFVPFLIAGYWAGYAPVVVIVNVWDLSPVCAIVVILVDVLWASWFCWLPARQAWKPLFFMACVILIVCGAAVAYSYSPIAAFSFHPVGVITVLLAGVFLSMAAIASRRAWANEALGR